MSKQLQAVLAGEAQGAEERFFWPEYRHSLLHLKVKRLFDMVGAAILIAFLWPLMLVIALVIKLTSAGPVLYRWPVVGHRGRPFGAFKFRTMVVDADSLKPQLMKFNEASGPVFKMKRDPRVTSVGRFLRRFSLDELPQLFNVLTGSMSLVGPRPVLDYEWEKFTPWQRQKLALKPGVVSLWHVSGQPRDLDAWVAMDLDYALRWSLALDLKILAGAVRYVLTGRNC